LNYESDVTCSRTRRARESTRREAIMEALANSTWAKHFMPYGPTRFVNGQNQGAKPLMLQVLKGDIKVVLPNTYAQSEPGVPPWEGVTRARRSVGREDSRPA